METVVTTGQGSVHNQTIATATATNVTDERSKYVKPMKSTTDLGASPKSNITKSSDSNLTQSEGNQSVPGRKSQISKVASSTADYVSDNQYFYEDEVFRLDKKGKIKFGLVIDTSGYYSGDGDESDEDISKGELHVIWYPDGRDVVVNQKTIGLADRTLMPGDVVRRLVPGKDTQRGYCRDIHMKADVRVLGSKYVIKNVNAERLRTITSWQRDSAVCLDSWVGSTRDVEDKAVLRTSTGCRIEISSNDFYEFKDMKIPFQSDEYDSQVFYPGNTVVGSLKNLESMNILTPDIPLFSNKKTNKKNSNKKFFVENVYTESVWVHWQCKALSDETNVQMVANQQPQARISGDDLKRLKCMNLFESCMLQINDISYLTYSACDTLVKKSDWYKEQSQKFNHMLENQQAMTDINNKNCDNTSNIGNSNETNNFNSQNSYDEKKKKKCNSNIDQEKSCSKLKKTSFKFRDKEKSSNKELLQKKLKNRSDNNDGDDGEEWTSDDEEDNIAKVSPAVKHSLKINMLNRFGNKFRIGSHKSAFSNKYTNKDNCEETNLKKSSNDSKTKQSHKSNEDSISSTETNSSCSSPNQTGGIRDLQKKTHESFNKIPVNLGDELVTQALLVYSTATVVWQDGIIEENIPSTDLYPIHYLDTHEFFPGDFVVSANDETELNFRDYGVIQKVDHLGRTAHVKWFTTYTSIDEPRPIYKGETENSVYDIKDHPDFQYRPGTLVIRVANFTGEDANCTAGQIIDNFIDGRVKVWWVDGHISMCWPQDLFEVGQYDNGDWGHDSDDSWETESENSELGGSCNNSIHQQTIKMQVLGNIEKAQSAIIRLEEIFNINSKLENPHVMRKLLSIYKGCRYLDRLMNTNFFHEDCFKGIIERVWQNGTRDESEHKTKILSDKDCINTQMNKLAQCQCAAVVLVNHSQKSPQQFSKEVNPKEYAPKVLFNISSTPFKISSQTSHPNSHTSINLNPTSSLKRKCSSLNLSLQEPQCKKNDDVILAGELKLFPSHDNGISEMPACQHDISMATFPIRTENNATQSQDNVEKNELLNYAMLNLEKAYEKTSLLKTVLDLSNSDSSVSQNDSGNFSRIESNAGNSDGISEVTLQSTALLIKENNENLIPSVNAYVDLRDNIKAESICLRLCCKLKEQMTKFAYYMRKKYLKNSHVTESDIFNVSVENFDIISDNEIIKDIEDLTKKTIGNTDISLIGIKSTDNDKKEVTGSNIGNDTDCFLMLSEAPKNHKFYSNVFQPNNAQQYYKIVQKEYRMLKSSLPPGVWIRVFEDRTDLLSVMIEGPKKTPYEDGIFLFDMQLSRDYPKSPPVCHYMSYCSDRLNPNLYEDGKVCVSLLGTWTGKDTETWGPNSTILQVIVSIQGLILVQEPYFNEAGYEKHKGTQQGKENSRMYNEMVIIKLIQSMTKLIHNPPDLFRDHILNHFQQNGLKMIDRINHWIEVSKCSDKGRKTITDTADSIISNASELATTSATVQKKYLPEFPLVPASRGFCLTLVSVLKGFEKKLFDLNNSKAVYSAD